MGYTEQSVRAFRSENDKEFLKHKEIVNFCIQKGVSLPEETAKFFESVEFDAGDRNPNNVDFNSTLEIELVEGVHFKKDDSVAYGIRVDISKLPSNVASLLFYMY